MITIVIADDQEMIRQSLEISINSKNDMKVVGTASNGAEAFDMVKKLNPDILLLDIRMPVMDGVQCIKKIKEKNLPVKTIVLTTFDDDEYIYEALKHGACGYLLKGISLQEMANSIKIVANGGTLINPDVATKFIKLFSNMAKADFVGKMDTSALDNFNTSERRIMQLVGRGFTNKEIVDTMNISEGTIRNYISSILNKMDMKNRTQLAIYSVQSGLAASDDILS